MDGLESVLVIITEAIFGVLAISTQEAALRSNKSSIEIVHAIAWFAEVLLMTTAFYLLVVFSTPMYAVIGFTVGIIVLIGGTIEIMRLIKK